ncbi:MAG: helix-turn-helix domain-containing protein [Blastocatellia bacterium]
MTDDGRNIALQEQQKILSALERKGWTQAAIAKRIGVRAQTVRAWTSNHSLTRSDTLERLKGLLKRPAPSSHRVVGRTKKKDLKRREWLLGTYSLRSPAERAATVRDWMKRTGCSRRDLADFLGVGPAHVEFYLSPRWRGRISLPVLERIASLLDGVYTVRSRIDRFHAAVERLFGPHIQTGFQRTTRYEVVKKLAPFLKMSERNVFRLLPPYRSSWAPSEAALRAFETAVQSLSRIYKSPETRCLIEPLLASEVPRSERSV